MANHNDKAAMTITFVSLDGGDGYFEPKRDEDDDSDDDFATDEVIAERIKRGCSCCKRCYC